MVNAEDKIENNSKELAQRGGYGSPTMFVEDKIDGLGIMKYNTSGDVVKGVFTSNGSKVKDY